ncbi:hypothetical protein [Roseospira visakhapatnamensis]|uniref:Uncharacterized protein n=1 Tax=Roseospira visakhapatnamensis TaxID=390880 RepID=A0A7W6W908_9PROT|nr:hypothetical protein [Roseospira visakhapatnamensis]MBB4265595.1 hypothetical protein [Roseospira visakhapatnamensis]
MATAPGPRAGPGALVATWWALGADSLPAPPRDRQDASGRRGSWFGAGSCATLAARTRTEIQGMADQRWRATAITRALGARVVGLLAVLVVLLPGGGVGPSPAAGAGAETLRFTPPTGWREVHRVERDGLSVRHLVPPAQGGETWRDMITVQVLRTARPPTLEDLHARALAGYRADCDGARGGALQRGESNGYPTGFWVLGCPTNTRTGRGETAFFKATLGEQAVYVLQRVWRTDPFSPGADAGIDAAARREAIALLKAARVCRPGSTAHPCR